MQRRFPKFGFNKKRFNNGQFLTPLNLGKLAYHIEKGTLDADATITMSDLFRAGAVSKITDGVKLLGKGHEKFEALSKPVSLEISDASSQALEAVKGLGGNVLVQYRTRLLMRQHLKPHKFAEHKELKTPMPPQKKVKKLERLERKGLEVHYPDAPWFTDNKATLLEEQSEKARRLAEG